MKHLRTLLATAALSAAMSVAAAPVVIPTALGQYFDWNDAVLTNCSVENSGANIGSTHAGSKAVFTLQNDNRMDYVFTFASGASNLTAVLNAQITNAEGTELYSNDFDISNTGSWSLTEAHSDQISKLEAGTLTLTLTIKSTTASYAGNFGKLAFYTWDDWFASYPQVPSDDYLPLPEGTYTHYSTTGSTTPKYESNGNIGYIKNGGVAEYTFYCNTAAYYNLSMGISTYSGGNIEAQVIDQTTGTVEASGTFTIPSSGNYARQEFEFADVIKKGVKVLKMTFVADHDSWVMNYKDVTLTKRADYDDGSTRYNVSVSQNIAEAGTVTQTPSGTSIVGGSNVRFTAKPNFGYHFVRWTDAEGNELSTENPYTIQLNSDVNVVAVFEAVQIYALNLNVDGAYEGMITFSPEPTIVNYKNMYEEGQTVTLTASENEAISFNYWSDGSTNKTLNVLMDGDKDITAYYAAGDYVAAWDFHKAGTVNSYPADFYASYENNEASLYLRNFDTNSAGSRGMWVRDNQQVVIWGNDVDYAYELHWNTLNYTDMRVKCTLWYSYTYWELVQPQYSLDAENWINVGDPITMTTSQTVHEFTLPAEANHQENVYFRLLPDVNSTLLNPDASTYRPCWITDLYIFGQQSTYDDGQAPKYVASVPADGATGASATGRIVLTYDEKIALTDNFSATLGGEKIEGTAAGKTLIFPYSALKYNTQYAFHLAAGSVADPAGNVNQEEINFSFTTMQRTQPKARLYDAIVAQDGTGDYTSVAAAIDAAPSNRTEPWLIFVKEGTYESHVTIPSSKPYIHLIGEGRSLVNVTFYGQSGAMGDDTKATADQKGIKYEIDGGPTVVINAKNFYTEGITYENSYGYLMLNGPQALAIRANSDRVIFNKVEMRSYQDTYLTSSTVNDRQYIKDSWITGAVDFIYGQGNIYFDTDTININRSSGGFIVAPNHDAKTTWGYVFSNNLITTTYTKNPDDYSVWLGRPWHGNPKTVYLHTKMEVTPYDSLFYETMGGLPALWAAYDLTDKYGNPRSTVARKCYYYKDGDKKVWGYAKNYLTDEEAATYTVANVLRGSDDWLPEQICEPTEAPVISNSVGTLSWEAVPYAICYVILRDGKAYDFTTETSYAVTDNALYSVKAASEYGALSAPSNAVKGDESTIGITELKAAEPITGKVYDLYGRRTSRTHGLLIEGGKVNLR